MIDFSHKSYLDLLEYIKSLGYRIGPFRDFPQAGPYVILRHDIDFSVPKAEEMAALDQQAGVRSSFFVLPTDPYYNPLWENNLQALKRIVAMGHEVGLHYDSTGFDQLTPAEQQRRIDTVVACLESYLSIKVTTVAQHKPAAAKIKVQFAGYADAYSHPFFKDIGYISDSRMLFRVEDVYAFFRDNPRCQAVLHPVWWHAQPKTRAQIFEEIKTQLAQQFSRMIDDEHQVILDSLPGISPQGTQRTQRGSV